MRAEAKVLIVTPPAIKHNWKDTINNLDKRSADRIAPYIQIVTTGSIEKLVDIEEDRRSLDSYLETEYFNDELEEELTYNDYGLILR